MITRERIAEKYDVIHGDYDPEAAYRAAVAHCHFVGDTTSRLRNMVHSAVEAGVDTITVTDHDTISAQDEVKQTVDKYGYAMEVFPGIEVSAVGSDKKPRHVLVYGVEAAPPVGLSPKEVNAWAHGKTHPTYGRPLTAAAHPELLDFSLRKAELVKVQASEDPNERFDLGEIKNGAVLGLYVWRKKHPVLERVLKNKMPSPTANARMKEIVFAQADLAPIGGSDAHESAGVANVVNLVPKGMTLFEAASRGALVIIQKKKKHIESPSLARIGVGFVRGTVAGRQRKKSWKQAGVL